jgi:hypothetical protein
VGLKELSIEKVRFLRSTLKLENALNAQTYKTMFVSKEPVQLSSSI